MVLLIGFITRTHDWHNYRLCCVNRLVMINSGLRNQIYLTVIGDEKKEKSRNDYATQFNFASSRNSTLPLFGGERIPIISSFFTS